LCAWRRDLVRLWLNRALFRRSWREDFALLAGLRLRFGFGRLLYFFLAFVFVSHVEQFAMDTRLVQRALRQGRNPRIRHGIPTVQVLHLFTGAVR